MAICGDCNQEMLLVTSCSVDTVMINSEQFDRLPYKPVDFNRDVGPDHRCHDCGVAAGGFHHPGCDMERCPKCAGQMICCECPAYGEEEE